MGYIQKHSFSFILLILFLLFMSFSFSYLYGVYKTIKLEKQSDLKVNTDLKYDLLVKELNEIKHDTFFLADIYKNIHEKVDIDNSSNLLSFKFTLHSFSDRHPIYAQIRFLTIDGKETLRINNKNGEIAFVSKEKLQDKSNRYYFQDALALQKDQLYLSKFDLNVENGKIDIPFNPTLRVVMPIFKDGKKIAYVIINYSGEKILQKIKETNNKDMKTILLNKDGYYLIADEKEKEWSFMFDGASSLKAENLSLWNIIKAKSNSTYGDKERIYNFKELYPSKILNNKEEAQKWILLSYVQVDIVDKEFQNYFINILHIFVFFVVVIVVFSYILWRYIDQINRYEKKAKLTAKKMDEIKRINSLGELINNIAHQWRQPLAAIRMSANNIEASIELNMPMDKKELQECVHEIDGQTQYLTETIDSLHNKFVLDKEERISISVKELIESVLSRFEDQFSNDNIILIKDIEDMIISGQKYQLNDALFNILKNAQESIINNSLEDQGYIYISSKRDIDSGVNITIKDSGGGIDPKIMSNIFEPYVTTKHKAQGTGISLYITYHVIVMNHHGDIVVKNVESLFKKKRFTGGCFLIYLP